MKKIVQKEDEILREIAQEVPVHDITSPKIKKIIEEMKVALASQEDGVAIAAPQIGYSLRIFVISSKFLPGKINSATGEEIRRTSDMIFINPTIIKFSREKKEMEEGCLSVRYLYGKVMRSQKTTIAAYDETGKKFTMGASGLISQIFQHEVDHLNGILFIDKARFVEEVIPEHIEKKISRRKENHSEKNERSTAKN